MPCLVSNSLTINHFYSVDLIDATLAFEDANSKLDAVSAADVDAEECADHSLVEN